eukprot:TRINITY_DN1337_c0_g1_i2.p1 TRINITY_DN1337_c0_g1~~TRINITY_DN1337_c0_g1_i2.p1  ORF type:complete len:344 (-),score=13.71 TRINITY_DN1337_c0_g1_i2:83-1114(-)
MDTLQVFAILALFGLVRCHIAFSYTTFSPSDLLSLQLNKYTQSLNPNADGKILLTSFDKSAGGSAFFKNPIALAGSGTKGSFSTAFSFQMNTSGGGGDKDGQGADGIMFIIYSATNQNGPYGKGAYSGSGMGYSGLQKSVGIEFDTYVNSDVGDPNGNHIGININGQLNGPTASIPTRLNDGRLWWAWVDYNGFVGIIEVRVATSNIRPTAANLIRAVNLTDVLQTPDAYVGFTASTGRYYQAHSIHSWYFTTSEKGSGISKPIGAIGAIVGGIAAGVFLAGAVGLYIRKRRRHGVVKTENNKSDVVPMESITNKPVASQLAGDINKKEPVQSPRKRKSVPAS